MALPGEAGEAVEAVVAPILFLGGELMQCTPPPVSMGNPMGTATGESPTATRMSARMWAFVRLTVEPLDGGSQPRRTSLRSAARARDCIVLSGEPGSREAMRRRASSRRRGVTVACSSADRSRMDLRVMPDSTVGAVGGYGGAGVLGAAACAAGASWLTSLRRRRRRVVLRAWNGCVKCEGKRSRRCFGMR